MQMICARWVDEIEAAKLDLEACGSCGRKFAKDRLLVHMRICGREKKRRVFNMTKVRVRGTEAEAFVASKPSLGVASTLISHGAAKMASSSNNKGDSSNWRQKHNEFIAAIRYAKRASKAEREGGRLPTPPPASLNPDYVQCPFCLRRFNETAATRHIPKCKDTVNRPKPPPTQRTLGPGRTGPVVRKFKS